MINAPSQQVSREDYSRGLVAPGVLEAAGGKEGRAETGPIMEREEDQMEEGERDGKRE